MPKEEKCGQAHSEFSYEHLELEVSVEHASGNIRLAIGSLCLEFISRVQSNRNSMCWPLDLRILI